MNFDERFCDMASILLPAAVVLVAVFAITGWIWAALTALALLAAMLYAAVALFILYAIWKWGPKHRRKDRD